MTQKALTTQVVANGTGSPMLDQQIAFNQQLTALVANSTANFNDLYSGTTVAPPTIASATTIAPATNLLFVSGTTAIVNITPPGTMATNGGQITIIPKGIFTTTTAGNIALASTAVVSKTLTMTYDSVTTKWYPSY